MAGKLVVDTIDTDNAFITLNVQQSLIATMNVSGIYSNTGVKMIGANGTVSNTAITGNIISSQITSNPTLYGNVSVTGVIAVGGATPTTNGSGITFPATQSASSDANTLDDYEEGTWTPTVSFSGGNGTLSYTARVGNYVKIGNTVFISMTLTINKGTASGTFDSISGLPFTSSINSGGGAYSDNFTGLSGAPEWTIASGGTLLYYYSSATGSATAINATSFSTNSVLRVFAAYIV